MTDKTPAKMTRRQLFTGGLAITAGAAPFLAIGSQLARAESTTPDDYTPPLRLMPLNRGIVPVTAQGIANVSYQNGWRRESISTSCRTGHPSLA